MLLCCRDSGLWGQWAVGTKGDQFQSWLHSYVIVSLNKTPSLPGASFYLEMHPVLAAPGLHSERGYDSEPHVLDVCPPCTSDFQPKFPSRRTLSLLRIPDWLSRELQTAARLHRPSAGITDVQHSCFFFAECRGLEHSGPCVCVTGIAR